MLFLSQNSLFEFLLGTFIFMKVFDLVFETLFLFLISFLLYLRDDTKGAERESNKLRYERT